MRLLAIGNSFSSDATYYLHKILDAAGVENTIVNLYIGGCSLERHWKNIEPDLAEYEYQYNGTKPGRMISIREALEEGPWDLIVTQQVSSFSGWLDSYEPFLGNVLDYVKEKAPGAKLFLHQTWAYEVGSAHASFPRYNRNQQEMFERLQYAYSVMADKYQLPLIRSGELIQKVRQLPWFRQGGELSICRDGFHMHHIYGRYAVACAWAKTVFGVNVLGNSYVPHSEYLPDEETNMEIVGAIQNLVAEL